jgi:hypothetical protein
VSFQRLAAALAAAVILTVATRRAEACAGCRNPSLAAARGGEGPLDEGAVRLEAALTGTTVHVVHEAGCRDTSACGEVPVQPTYFHDQNLYPVELRLVGEYGITKTFGIEAQVPFRSVTSTIEYTDANGAHYEPLDPGVHHRNETVVGIADPWLLLRVGTTVQSWWLAARPGLSIPLGRTEENPFELGDRGLQHQHIQLGSGTIDPVAIIEASRAFEAIQLQFFAQGQVPLYENGQGYRAPFRVYGGGSVGHQLVSELSGSLGVEASHEAAEKWDGEVRQDGNLGRTELLLAATLSYRLGASKLGLSARVPVWRQIVTGDEPPGSLSSPIILGLSATHIFGGKQPPSGDLL